MKIRTLCVFLCCLSASLWSSPLRFTAAWKTNALQQRISLSNSGRKTLSPSRPIYFDDHRPAWVFGWGPNLMLSKVFYYDPYNGSYGTAVSESNFGLGLLLCGGMNLPLATFNENAGIGLNIIPSVYGGLGYLGFNAPATIMLKYGQGATHYFTSDWCLGIGAGYGISAVQYYDLYTYAYAVNTPFIVFELGYDPAVLRFEIFDRHHIAKIAPPNRGEFLEIGLQFLYYLEDRD